MSIFFFFFFFYFGFFIVLVNNTDSKFTQKLNFDHLLTIISYQTSKVLLVHTTFEAKR